MKMETWMVSLVELRFQDSTTRKKRFGEFSGFWPVSFDEAMGVHG